MVFTHNEQKFCETGCIEVILTLFFSLFQFINFSLEFPHLENFSFTWFFINQHGVAEERLCSFLTSYAKLDGDVFL